MKRIAVVAALAVTALASACTHTHQVADPKPMPTDSVDHLRGALEGAGVGTLAGAAAGAVAGFAEGDDPPCGDEEWFCLRFSAGDKAMILGVAGAGSGAMIGLLVGAAIGSTDHYERAPAWRPTVNASVTPSGGQATATWQF